MDIILDGTLVLEGDTNGSPTQTVKIVLRSDEEDTITDMATKYQEAVKQLKGE